MLKPATRVPACTRQRGMTLIEILVAIVVLSIGLLGLAGLQLKGLQVNQGSTYRWQAAMLAEDIADRIRADRPNAPAYVLNFGTNPTASGNAGTDAALADWLARVQALPNGQAQIAEVVTATNTIQIQIQVTWVDARAKAGAGDTRTGTTDNIFTLKTELAS